MPDTTDILVEPSLAPLAARATVPAHVAIIMDGNGRWAASRRLPRIAGHREGARAVRRTHRGGDPRAASAG